MVVKDHHDHVLAACRRWPVVVTTWSNMRPNWYASGNWPAASPAWGAGSPGENSTLQTT